MDNLIFVDCEAAGVSAWSGTLTEFGAVHYATRDTYHGQLFESTPDPANPAVPVPSERLRWDADVAPEVWAVAIFGYGPDHDQTLTQYQKLAANHPNIHVYSFDQVANPAEVAEDMAIAVLPQSAGA